MFPPGVFTRELEQCKVRRLLESYALDALEWAVREHGHAIVIEILTRIGALSAPPKVQVMTPWFCSGVDRKILLRRVGSILLRLACVRPFMGGMRIPGSGAAASSYGASAPAKVQAQPVRADKTELKPSDGFASSQLPAGVGENLNIKA
jgi:hypothetical protein